MTAMDTFRVVAGASNSSETWVRSAYDNFIRELQAVLATEETKQVAELRGVLRDVLTQLEESSALAERIRDTLGVLPMPPEIPPG